MNNFEAVLDDPHSLELLSVVSAVHHHAINEALNERATSLLELSGLPSTERVGQVLGVLWLDRNVVAQGDILHYNVIK